MSKVDPIKLQIFRALYTSVAEEMGLTLRRTGFSPNIKERRDYSCAVFDARGRLVAQGDHMPVHLGSMPMSVRAAIDCTEMEPGDVVFLNDPYAGGTHLPDVTMVAPVYDASRRKPRLLFFVANRAHHADIGGAHAGSMGSSTEIYQEGFRIPPVKLVSRGVVSRDVRELFLHNVRVPEEREGDLTAQIGALRVGQTRLLEFVARYGFAECDAYARHLIEYTARMVRHVLEQIPDGTYAAEDFLDDDGEGSGPVRIAVAIIVRGSRATIDFTGSAPQVRGPVNAVEAITISACYYVFRCLLEGFGSEIPASEGVLDALDFVIPSGAVVNALPPSAVAGGNVETSQRTVDVLFKALAQALPDRIPAASQGTMNNLTIGGIDPRTRKRFAYYETVAGGMGARPGLDGASGIHNHMTNSLNTPAEALEYSYPLRVTQYSLRRNSGGRGRACGGDGVVREIEILADGELSLLSDRRKFGPYGLAGGAPGKPGRAFLLRGTRAIELASKTGAKVRAGDRIRIETPGGGGFGTPRGAENATHSRRAK